MPCVVVAGYPNVGKSSIVKNISTNKKIEVQEYPFTTKKLNMGHLELERRFDKIRIQCLDTPGILDRPMAKRNNIELQAIYHSLLKIHKAKIYRKYFLFLLIYHIFQ
ncbi:unnamed protein product [marine sediment metagenome]|uniref:G domain-containing protein n=1 Tax=marine sediment metagenome TaxID=412755 RepID=X1F4L3_9ZZZZ